MRLLLDVHVSGKNVAQPLRAAGHDVRAANEDAALDRLDDPSLLLLAAEESRILVTANVKDFVPIVQQRNAAGRQHAGCIFIPPHIRQDQFGRILTGIRAALDDVPEQAGWIDRIHYLR